MTLLGIVLALALAGVAWTLICGVSAMATGHDILHHSSDEWMFRRVGFQAAAIVAVLALALSGA